MPTLYLGAKREIATFAGEMRQVLSNLPVNAIDAIEKMARLRFMLMLHVLLQKLTCRAEVHSPNGLCSRTRREHDRMCRGAKIPLQ
jgi:hypothetical protein